MPRPIYSCYIVLKIDIRKKITGAIALLALAAISVAHSAAAENGPLDGFDDYVLESMNAWEVPGLAVAIVKAWNFTYSLAFAFTFPPRLLLHPRLRLLPPLRLLPQLRPHFRLLLHHPVSPHL